MYFPLACILQPSYRALISSQHLVSGFDQSIHAPDRASVLTTPITFRPL